MGQALIRAAPDRDLYLVWSSIVDAPVAVGTRAEMVGWARQEWRLEEERAEAALMRADELGTSDRRFNTGGWDDDELPVFNGWQPPEPGWWYIRRDRLVEFAEAILRDDDAAATALLHRAPDEDEEVSGAS